MKVVIITGASAGMGSEFAKQLDQEVHVDEFWLIARRGERLQEIAAKLQTKVRIFAEDITKPEFVHKLENALSEHNADVKILVNNAGYGIIGSFAERTLEESLGMIDLNCRALTAVTGCVIPFMKKNARIIMAASSAAFVPQPGFAIYAATKSYVLSFSRALSAELKKKKIYVTAFCPGPVATEFFDMAEKYASSPEYKKKLRMQPEVVVAEVLRASKKKQTVVTPGVVMKMFRAAMKLVPADAVLWGMKLFSK